MANWARTKVGELPIHQAKTLSWLPGVVQGFTTRQGGVSKAPFDTLNLGAHVGDAPEDVHTNRLKLWEALEFAEDHIAMAEQVHGGQVAVVQEDSQFLIPGADALVTNVPDTLLMMLYADCVPVYLVDPMTRACGLIHAGWRGTLANVVGNTVAAMLENFGVKPRACIAAIGPSIGMDNYEVGADVANQFAHVVAQQSSVIMIPRNEFTGTFNLNLRQAIFSQLLQAGVRAEYVSVSDEDTFRNKRDFYSYRRDGAQTGRMAAYLSMRSV